MWLEALLTKYGKTEEEISDGLNVPKEKVNEWIRTNSFPTATQCVKLAEILGCTLEEVYIEIIGTTFA